MLFAAVRRSRMALSVISGPSPKLSLTERSGHRSALARKTSVANDPERTLSVRRSTRFGHPICDAFAHMIDLDQFFAFGMA